MWGKGPHLTTPSHTKLLVLRLLRPLLQVLQLRAQQHLYCSAVPTAHWCIPTLLSCSSIKPCRLPYTASYTCHWVRASAVPVLAHAAACSKALTCMHAHATLHTVNQALVHACSLGSITDIPAQLHAQHTAFPMDMHARWAAWTCRATTAQLQTPSSTMPLDHVHDVWQLLKTIMSALIQATVCLPFNYTGRTSSITSPRLPAMLLLAFRKHCHPAQQAEFVPTRLLQLSRPHNLPCPLRSSGAAGNVLEYSCWVRAVCKHAQLLSPTAPTAASGAARPHVCPLTR